MYTNLKSKEKIKMKEIQKIFLSMFSFSVFKDFIFKILNVKMWNNN